MVKVFSSSISLIRPALSVWKHGLFKITDKNYQWLDLGLNVAQQFILVFTNYNGIRCSVKEKAKRITNDVSYVACKYP